MFSEILASFKVCFDDFELDKHDLHLMLIMGKYLTDENHLGYCLQWIYLMKLIDVLVTFDKPTEESMEALMKCINS